MFASLANCLGRHDNLTPSIPRHLVDFELLDVEIRHGLFQVKYCRLKPTASLHSKYRGNPAFPFFTSSSSASQSKCGLWVWHLDHLYVSISSRSMGCISRRVILLEVFVCHILLNRRIMVLYFFWVSTTVKQISRKVFYSREISSIKIYAQMFS